MLTSALPNLDVFLVAIQTREKGSKSFVCKNLVLLKKRQKKSGLGEKIILSRT